MTECFVINEAVCGGCGNPTSDGPCECDRSKNAKQTPTVGADEHFRIPVDLREAAAEPLVDQKLRVDYDDGDNGRVYQEFATKRQALAFYLEQLSAGNRPTVYKVRKPADSPMAINADTAPQLGTPDWTFNNELTANRQPLTNADGSWNFPKTWEDSPATRSPSSYTLDAADAPQLPTPVWNFSKDW